MLVCEKQCRLVSVELLPNDEARVHLALIKLDGTLGDACPYVVITHAQAKKLTVGTVCSYRVTSP